MVKDIDTTIISNNSRSHIGLSFYHEFTADILAAITLSAKQKTLKSRILKLLKKG